MNKYKKHPSSCTFFFLNRQNPDTQNIKKANEGFVKSELQNVGSFSTTIKETLTPDQASKTEYEAQIEALCALHSVHCTVCIPHK